MTRLENTKDIQHENKLAIWDLVEKVSPEAISEGEAMSMLIERRLPGGYNGLASMVERFQRHYAPEYHKAPLRDRLTAIRNFTPHELKSYDDFELYAPATMKYLLHQDQDISPDDVWNSIREGISLVHTVIMNLTIVKGVMGFQTIFHPSYHWGEAAYTVASMAGIDGLSVVEEVSMPRHGLKWTGTPLVSLMYSFVLTNVEIHKHWPRWLSWWEMMNESLQFWLQILKTAGIDLEEYGRREVEWFEKSLAFKTGAVHLCLSRWVSPEPPRLVRLAGLRYGPRPKDWFLEWEVDEIQLMREFWEGVEQSLSSQRLPSESTVAIPCAIPGAWVD